MSPLFHAGEWRVKQAGDFSPMSWQIGLVLHRRLSATVDGCRLWGLINNFILCRERKKRS